MGNSDTPFEKVSAIYWNYDNYGSMKLTDLSTYDLLLYFSCFNLLPAQKMKDNTLEA